MDDQDSRWMELALELAYHAEIHNEIPVGAVLIKDNQLIGFGWNQSISTCDPTAHAEIVALRQAAKKLSNYRLTDTTLYVTLEPCAMCMGALLHGRVSRLVYAAADSKAGAVNHRIDCQQGILEKQCSELLKKFFKKRRGVV